MGCDPFAVSEDPSCREGSIYQISCISYIYIMIHYSNRVTVSNKVTLWLVHHDISCIYHLIRGTVVKDYSIRKAESHWFKGWL